MKKNSFLIGVGAIVVALITVFVIDPLDPSTLSTPFCLGIVLMGLSFRQPPRLLTVVSMAYCFLTILAITRFAEHSPYPLLHPYFWFFQRFGLFVVVCVLAIYLSHYRAHTDKNLTQIQEVLSKLPVPVIISDAAGYITYVNDALCALRGVSADSLIGQRYTDIFMDATQEGKAMRYYIELFEDQKNPSNRIELSASSAMITCMGAGVHRKMITVLEKPGG